MKLTLFPATERKSVSWKNGGGETQEVAAFPPGASMANFDWRISIATVSAAGVFSSFPEIDRHLTLLTGRLLLDVAGVQHDLMPGDSVAFDGEAPSSGDPVSASATDLNIMTRRTMFRADVSRFEVNADAVLPGGEGFIFAFGAARVEGHELAATDFLHFETAAPQQLAIAGGPVLVIRLARQSPAPSPDRP